MAKDKIRPFLWFDGKAREAIDFYVRTFPGGRALDEQNFEIAGLQFIAFDGGPHYEITPGISFMVLCDSQDEIDELWSKLVAAGAEELRCGWITDHFGVTWQIVPAILGDLLGDEDEARASRTHTALMEMGKLDIAKLRAAHAGALA